MIKSLHIENFILIDELNLDFKVGFNVITGETGAGKSIILNAIDMAFGARAAKEVIKTNTQRAFIELVIELKEDFDRKFLEDNGIEVINREIILSREITPTASRIRANGVLAAQDFIKDFREKLLDIHSQNETYTYTRPKHHIHLLDSYNTCLHKELLDEYKNFWEEYSNIKTQLERASEANNATENQIDFLKFQINEIEEAQISSADEDEKLEKELEVLLNAEKLKDLTYSSYYALSSDENSINEGIAQIKNNLSKALQFDDSLSDAEQSITQAQEILREIASSLRSYSENVEPDEEKINFIQERIEVLNKLKRKYGATLEDVISACGKFREELNLINFSQDEVVRLEGELKNAEEKLHNAGEKLSQSRKTLARELSEKITLELEKLELPKSRFEISITPKDFDVNGCDEVEFLISTNISEPLKPLIKVASGGEMSRVMLAIKTIFARNDKVDTVIFDEIDAGISGKASTSVAEAIKNLSKTHQIIAITHQPMIAAKASQHFYVKKSQSDITSVKVFTLSDEDKIKALAMLAAGEINEQSVEFAKQLAKE